MPRDVGTGLYTYPSGTPGISGQTIFSARYNTFINDLQNTLNTALPVNMGGTGASLVTDARKNLGAEASAIQVTDYSTHVFEPGSFYSLSSAAGEPVDGHAFAGICYGINDTVTPANTKLVIQARDLEDATTPGVVYTREKLGAAAWTAWVSDYSGTFVLKAGDTMTGPLTITHATTHAVLTLNKPNAGAVNVITGQTAAKNRWQLRLGETSVESGSNIGSDFILHRYDDAGTTDLGSPLTINRATGKTNIGGPLEVGASLVAALQPASPDQVIADKGASGLAFSINSYLNAAGSQWFGMVTGQPAFQFFTSDANTLTLRSHAGAGVTAGANVSFSDAGWSFNASNGAMTVGTPLTGSAYINSTIRVGYASGFGIALRPSADGNYPVVFVNAADALVGYITTSATTTTYATSSDERLKEDLKPFTTAGSIIDATNVYDFKWKNVDERAYGVIAQQAMTVYPLAVSHEPTADRFGVDYSKYVPVLLQEAKSLRQRAADATDKIAMLEARLAAGQAAALDVAVAVSNAMNVIPDNFNATNFAAVKIQLDALTQAFAAMLQAQAPP